MAGEWGRGYSALVTGGGRGIGAAIAHRLARAGYDILIGYQQDEAAAAAVLVAVEGAGVRGRAVRADVGSDAGIAALFAALDGFSPLQVLVNNAGMAGPRKPLATLEGQEIRRVLDVNLTAAILASGRAIGLMATSAGGLGGVIVNITSQAAVGGGFQMATYAAAKAGLAIVTQSLAREVAGDGIRVVAVSPGVIATDQQAGLPPERLQHLNSTLPMGRMGTPEEVAEAVAWLVSPAAAYVSGAILPVHGAR